jgi:hypothetical protein
MNGFPSRPKVLRGAFVEYGLSLPPLAVVFQFNPDQLQRSRSLGFQAPNEVLVVPQLTEDGETTRRERPQELRKWHSEQSDLEAIRTQQIVSVQEETLSFELRLDATDALDAGDQIAARFGIGPTLSTLELMTYPKGTGVLSQALDAVLGTKKGYQFSPPENPPLVLFLWGTQRVLPVNIESITITETEFDWLLNPIRATVAVSLTVIEGRNPVFRFTQGAREVMSVINAAQVVTDLVIPR